MPIVKLDPQFFNHDAQAGGFFPDTHINQSFDVDKFIQERGKNGIIQGIRGTGKTHILKMVAEKYLQNFPELKVIPVYVSLAKLSQYGEDDIKRFRMQVYANIVLASIHCIEQYRSSLGFSEKDSSGALVFLKRLFRIRPDKDFEGTIKEIKNLNERLLQRLTYNPQNVSLREAETVRGGIQTTLGIPSAGSATVDATTESETEKKS